MADATKTALWLRRRKFYDDNATMASMKAEDQVARHILRGLGYTANAIWQVEKALGIEMDYEAPALQHVRQILDVVSHGAFTPGENAKSDLTLDVREAKNGRKWIADNMEDLAEEAVLHGIGSIVVVRDPDPKRLCAFVLVHDCQTVPMWLLQPESLLLDKKYEMQVWCRQTKPLFYDMARYLQWELPDVDESFQQEKEEAPYVPVGFD